MNTTPKHIPTVHLNGTGERGLVKDRIAVLEALRNAEDALCAARPHMRDYYVGSGREGFDAATKRRQRQIARLAEVKKEITEEIHAIQEQAR